MKKAVLIIASAVFMMSCGDNATTNESTTAPAEDNATMETPAETAPEATEPEMDADVPAEVTLEISGDDQMKYDKSELRVKAGQKVTLVLKHTGKLPKKAMGHNWTLLKDGVDWKAFDHKALKFADNDYMPDDADKDVIAHTDMIGGGEETSVTFDAPAKGEYTYICTFPGHATQMQGTFIVE